MNWDAIGAVGEVLGAFGVLASLVYLAVQIRDNTRNLQAASLQSVLDGPRDRFFLPQAQSAEISHILAAGIDGLENLDANEQRRFFFVMYEQLFQMQQVMQLRQRGLISEIDHDTWLRYTASLLKTPGGAATWAQAKRVIAPTIRDLLDGYLERNPDLPPLTELLPLFRFDAPRDDNARQRDHADRP